RGGVPQVRFNGPVAHDRRAGQQFGTRNASYGMFALPKLKRSSSRNSAFLEAVRQRRAQICRDGKVLGIPNHPFRFTRQQDRSVMLKDIKVTLYDVFAYLIPGAVLVAALAMVVWAFHFPNAPLSFSLPGAEAWVVLLAVAYVGGHMVQGLSNDLLKLL